MEYELIPIIRTSGRQLVNARDLHEFLESKRKFTDWIEYRIQQYGFIENVDYVLLNKFVKNSGEDSLLHNFVKQKGRGGRNAKEYGLTISMAKELSMLENNEKGKMARKYFIAMEEKARERYKLKPPSRKQLAQWVVELEDENEAQRKLIRDLRPKAELMEKILDTDTMIDIGQTAKVLGLGYGRNTLFKRLRSLGVFFKGRNEPKQEYVERGYFVLKEKYIERDTHEPFTVLKVLVTQKGIEFIARILGVTYPPKRQALLW